MTAPLLVLLVGGPKAGTVIVPREGQYPCLVFPLAPKIAPEWFCDSESALDTTTITRNTVEFLIYECSR